MADPFQNLPPELVSRIFELQEWSWPAGYSDSPLRLGEVCQQWRNIAWNTPELWNVVSVYFDPEYAPSIAGAIEDLVGYIERSGCLPLTLHVIASKEEEFDELQPDEELEDAEDISSATLLGRLIEVINQCSPRWSHLNLQLPTYLWSSFTLDPALPVLPTRLRMIRLSCMDQDPNITPIPQIFAQSLPYLESLMLKGAEFKPSSIRGTWNNLTTLTVASWDVTSCMEAIQRAPALRNADFEVVSSEPLLNLQFTPIIHNSLESLEFKARLGSADSSAFFQTITLQSLKRLVLTDQCSALSVSNMLERSSPAVSFLGLLGTSWSTAQICFCLFKLRALKQLTTERAVSPLNPAILLPYLFIHETLEVINLTEGWQAGSWKFLECISLGQDRTLRSVHLTFKVGREIATEVLLEPLVLRRVMDLRNAGVDIDLKIARYSSPDLDVIEASSLYHSNLDRLD